MKRKAWLIGALALGLAATGVSKFARSADHLDSPAPQADISSDITDTYSWVDGKNLVLIMNVAPLGMADKFSDKIQYVFHTSSGPAFGMTKDDVNIIATFDASQKIQLWVGATDYVTGDASDATKPLASASGLVTVFAGKRSDPFFFNLGGFKDTVATVDAAAGSLTFNKEGCPAVDAATSMALVKELQGTMKGAMPAVDTFDKQNVLSIVIAVDLSLVTTSTGKVVSFWGSTNKGS